MNISKALLNELFQKQKENWTYAKWNLKANKLLIKKLHNDIAKCKPAHKLVKRMITSNEEPNVLLPWQKEIVNHYNSLRYQYNKAVRDRSTARFQDEKEYALYKQLDNLRK